ncbi:MAG: UbiA prenyltransferase family protein [Candidatus Lokiarchaeota archaeon]|nr:UbiA prenyltransferase family protein [Candidatus Lokiarchaeota archaeon]
MDELTKSPSKKMRAIIRCLRPHQWYKNGVILLGIFFGGKILDYHLYLELLVGFITLGFVSSLNYLFNDLIDYRKDQSHPEKKTRPIAAGNIKIGSAVGIAIILIILIGLGNWGIYLLSSKEITINFSAISLLIIIHGLFYTLLFKHYAIIDVLTLSLFYIWRTLAGIFIADVVFSPWLYLIVFLSALLLAVNKRKADLLFLGKEKAILHKPIYSKYSTTLLTQVSTIAAVGLFMTYAFYCILGPLSEFTGPELQNNQYFILCSIPIALYIVLRYLYIVETKLEVARKAEKALFDVGIITGGIILVIVIYIANYVPLPFW